MSPLGILLLFTQQISIFLQNSVRVLIPGLKEWISSFLPLSQHPFMGAGALCWDVRDIE